MVGGTVVVGGHVVCLFLARRTLWLDWIRVCAFTIISLSCRFAIIWHSRAEFASHSRRIVRVAVVASSCDCPDVPSIVISAITYLLDYDTVIKVINANCGYIPLGLIAT